MNIDNGTLVFDKETANAMIRKGYNIKQIIDNKNNPDKVVFVFDEGLKEVREEILRARGLK